MNDISQISGIAIISIVLGIIFVTAPSRRVDAALTFVLIIALMLW